MNWRSPHVRFVPIGDISCFSAALASLHDQDRREVIYARNLPRNSSASCLGELRTIYGSG